MSLCRSHFRKQLGCPWDVSQKLLKHWMSSVVLLPSCMLKLYFKNVIEMNFIECVKLKFSGRPQNIIMWTSPRDIFHTSFGRLSTNLCNIEGVSLCFCLHVYLHIYMFTYSQY